MSMEKQWGIRMGKKLIENSRVTFHELAMENSCNSSNQQAMEFTWENMSNSLDSRHVK